MHICVQAQRPQFGMRVGWPASNLRPEQPDQRSAVASSPVVYGVLPGSGFGCEGGTGFVIRTGTSMRGEGTHSQDDDDG